MREIIKSYKSELSVIIAEDDPDHRELMCRSLEKSRLFDRIECVYSGTVCLSKLSDGGYDIAVIDYRIPGINGLEILNEASRKGWDIPIVIVTGMGDERVAVEVMKQGAYDYIPKTGDLLYTLPHILSKALERYFLKKRFLEQEERFRIMVQHLPIMVGAIDEKLGITMWNRECELVTGYSAKEVIGNLDFMEIFFPDKNYRKELWSIYLSKKGDFRDMEMMVTCRDGSLKIISWSNMPKHYEVPGGGTWAVGIDITERKKLQEQLMHSEKLSAVGQLAAGVAHEFNNLLTVIMGRAQLAFEEDSIPEIRKSLVEIEKKTRQGGNLVKNLGAFARPHEPRFQAQDIADVIDEVVKLQKRQLQLENIEIRRDYKKHSRALFDRGQMEQVFLNLLINATHAIKPKGGGVISIYVSDVEGNVQVKFSDNGAGMDERTRMKVFEPFFTTKGAWSVDGLGIPGTGLGLSISHSIITQHNGTIEAESEKGNGTTFIIKLPVCETDNAGEPALPVKIPDADAEGLKHLKILLLDDEEDMVSLLKLLFAKAGFAGVRVESSAEKALSIFTDFKPDIVFADILMPGMNGEQFFDRVREIDNDVPIVFMTGKLDVDAGKYLNKGACAFIHKPFDIKEVVTILKKECSGDKA